jgi:DNA invertase Pin-like site-specific DNA recombinase
MRTVGAMALVAQHEREAIGARTKAALAAAQAPGIIASRVEGSSSPVPGKLPP